MASLRRGVARLPLGLGGAAEQLGGVPVALGVPWQGRHWWGGRRAKLAKAGAMDLVLNVIESVGF